MVVIDRYQLLGVVRQHPVQRTVGRFFHNGIDFFDRSIARCDKGQIHNRHIDGWYTNRIAIKLAIQLWQYQPNSNSSAGFRWDHRHGRRASATQVFVHYVRQYLIVGVCMHRGHQTVQ